MNELLPMWVLATAGATAFHTSSTARRYRSEWMLGLSLVFLWHSVSPWYVAALVGWVALVYGLAQAILAGRLSAARVVVIYPVAVAGVFLSFRFNLLPLQGTNILGGCVVPVGFSFLMFQSIGFLFACANGTRRSLPRMRDFYTASLFFPTLTLGPFCSTEHHLTQLKNLERDPWDVFKGLSLFSLGLAKFGFSSLILAPEILGPLPLNAVAGDSMHPGTKLFLASVYFYTNFSGYYDMICGTARIMGFELPFNVVFPFWSRSMAEYWRHWHITLGAWFRDHVFFRLNFWLSTHERRLHLSADGAMAMAVMVTFLLIGVWHGVGEKFLLWGALNGVCVAFVRFGDKRYLLGTPLTFGLVLLINGFFLSASVDAFLAILLDFLPSEARYPVDYNVLQIAFGAVALLAFYGSERVIYRLEAPVTVRSVAVRFAMTVLFLFGGVILSTSAEKFVYTGY